MDLPFSLVLVVTFESLSFDDKRLKDIEHFHMEAPSFETKHVFPLENVEKIEKTSKHENQLRLKYYPRNILIYLS